MKLTRLPVLLGLGLTLASVTAGLWFFSARNKAVDVRYRSQIAIPGFQSSALVILASELGYFRDEGVDASLIYKATGKECLALVVAGEADLAVVFETPVTHSLLAGNDVVVLTEVHRSETNTAVVSRLDRGILNANDLRGKRIVTVPKTNAEYHLELYLRSHLIEALPVRRVKMSILEAVAAVKAGHVDAAALWEPYVSQAVDSGPEHFTLLRSSFYSEFSMLTALRAKLDGQKEATFAILRALLRARNYYDENRLRARSLVDRILAEKKFFVSTAAWEQTDIHLGLSATLLTMLTEEANWYLQSPGSMPARQADLKSVLRGEYLKALAPELVTYE